METEMNRRKFLAGAASSVGALGLGGAGAIQSWSASGFAQADQTALARPDYKGPNIIIIRFGGGVRRLETIDPQHTYSPYLVNVLMKRGVFYPLMEIESREGLNTSHGEGTLNIITGKYDTYKDTSGKFLGERFEAKVPTLFEYMREAFNVPEHQTLIVNGEDRLQEEFFTFSNHHLYGVGYRSNVLSLYRFKIHVLKRLIEKGRYKDKELEKMKAKLDQMMSLDPRVMDRGMQSEAIENFWERWREYYGQSGLVNPRGDRLLTELSVRALRELRPKLMMVNYNDCDYVHWGYLSHYTRGIQIMDEGLQRIVEAVEADPEYRENTVFAIVPDCGRDNNRGMSVPCQHHFNSKMSHEIFALFFGTGIARDQKVDKGIQQIGVAPTLARLMGIKAQYAEGSVMEEVFS